jgi:hypothetical protein
MNPVSPAVFFQWLLADGVDLCVLVVETEFETQ